MRSIEEIDADIAEVQKRIAARNEGMPSRKDPTYRAARFDYIVEGDRSGLDAYQSALNTAIQNKLNRESSEYMAELSKGEADLEKDDEIVKHISDVDAVIDDLKKRNYADDSVEMKKAKNEQDYWLRRADRRGLNVSLYRDTPKPPAESNTPAAAASQTAPQGRSYEDLSNYLTTIKDDKSVNRDTVKALRAELDLHKDKVPFSKMSESINLLNAKDKELADSEWNEYNSRVKAALGEKDYAKRKAALEPLKEELAKHKGQEKYAEVEKSINDGLKKPKAVPTVGYIKNLKAVDLMNTYLELTRKKTKDGAVVKNDNVDIGGTSYPYKVSLNNDGSLTVSCPGYSRTFKKEEFNEKNVSNIQTNPPKTSKPNVVADTLTGGQPSTIKFGMAPVSED